MFLKHYCLLYKLFMGQCTQINTLIITGDFCHSWRGNDKISSLNSCMRVTHLSHVWLFATPWTVACQSPLSMGIFQARIQQWISMPSFRGFSQPRDQTLVSRIAARFFTVWATREAHNGILLSYKKEWNNAICSNMDGPGDDHIKWSNSDREKQISYDIAYMQNLKKKLKKWYKWTYLQNINKLTNIETRDQIYGYPGELCREGEIESLGLTCTYCSI